MGRWRHCQQLPFLPDEVVFHILLWLPVRSLLEFKRVCKSWKTIISNPQFANNHHQNLTLNPSMTHQRVFCSMINQYSDIVSYPMKPLLENKASKPKTVKFNMAHSNFSILGSCNGLLCLFHIDQGYVMLWNPCIRYESNIPPSLDCHYKRTAIYYYGFGYDHVNEKYKVLVVMGQYSRKKVTKIYTFGGNSWTAIQDLPCYVPIHGEGKFVSGTLNWGAVSSTSNDNVILSLDLEKETYTEVLLPDDDGVKNWNYEVSVLSNCLCVYFGPTKTHWNLWVMKKYGVGESWTRLTMIRYKQLWNHVSQHLVHFIKPLFIFENSTVLLSINTKFVLLNLNNGRLDECRLGSRYIGSEQYIYYASLVSPQL